MNKFLLVLASIAAALATVIAIFFKGKSDGKQQEQAEQIKEKVKDGLEIKKDIDAVHSASANDIDRMLRQDCRD